MKNIYIFICLVFLPFVGFSQGEFYNWYFGGPGPPIGAGLTFNSGSPVAIPNGVMFSASSPISVSDSSGNLLFFSDGVKVYNRNKVVMPNGSGLLGGNQDLKQMVISTPIPGDDSSYYIFTAAAYDPLGPDLLHYSIINMRLDGGLGDIEPSFKNVPIPGSASIWWSVTGTKHKNNKDVWIITTISTTTHLNYAAFLINNSGIVTTPVLSYSAGFGQMPFVNYWNPPIWIRISQDGTKLIALYFGKSEYCTFNPQTGSVSRLFYIPTDNFGGNTGAEFSIDSKYLYVAKSNPNGALYQYNATLLDSVAFMQSRVMIDSGYKRNGLQMGPDWKIYGTEYNVDSMSVIQDPSNYGQNCHYQRNAIALTGPNISTLPQFIQRYKTYIHHTGFCQKDSVQFIGDIYPPPDSVHWDFGDPGSGLNNYSNLFNATHIYANTGTYTVELFVRHIDNRTDTSWQTITIVASPSVALGPDKSVCVGDSVTFDAGACSGCTYLWKDLGSGLPVGNSQTFKTGLAGNYSVTVTNINGCSGIDTVQLITMPVPSVTNNPLSKSICSGESTNISLISSVPGANFHWTATLTSGTITGFSSDSGLVINQVLVNPLSTSGVVTYHIFARIGNCTGDTVNFPVTVNPGDSVKVSITASNNNVCAGTPVTFTATPTNPGISPVYLWKVNGINSGTNSTSFIYTPLNNDVVTCMLTSSLTVCISNNPATSNAITMIVNPALPVSVTISASANPVCSGTSVTFTATSVNGGSTPVYQWKVNGLPVGTNNPVYTFVPLTGDIVTCTLTSNALCGTGSPATSTPVIMTVNPNMPVSVSISASSNPFCQGSTVTFIAMPTNGGSTPAYQWKVNGINAGTNSSSYSYIPNNGDVVTCVLTSNIACPMGNPANSNILTMIQNNTVPVSVSIAASSNPVCAGTSVTFTATPVNGGAAPVYQWKLNGSNVGTNSTTYTYIPVNGDVISCTLTSNAACASGNPATSNSVTMTVNPNLPVSVSVSASANPVCAGTAVIFTATGINGGSTPVYQWKVNGVNAGSNSSTFSYVPVAGDQVSCILTSNATCPTGNPAVSNVVLMTVNPNMPVSVNITASANPICSGFAVTFSANSVNGGSTPAYQWKVNGINAGTNSSTYTYNPAAGDQVQCILTSNIICPTGNPAASNTITMNVASPPVVTFTSCFDTITTNNAKPIKLKGGIPLGGTYSGSGVNSLTGIFTPSMAGAGTHTITYTYTNASLCTAAKTRTITVLSTPAFTCGNNLTDIRDNNVYSTVQIGTQCWLAANLNFGSTITSTQDQRDNCIAEKYCYNDNPANCTSQGGLYQWDEMMRFDDTPAGQGFCPPGWHVPTENDWKTLFSVYINNGFAGNPLKYSGYSGFNALLSGARHINQGWNFQGFAVFFWSSTPRGSTKAWAHGMNDIDPSVSFYPSSRVNAFSIRCLKD